MTELEELREQTREAHAALKDLRALIKTADEAEARLLRAQSEVLEKLTAPGWADTFAERVKDRADAMIGRALEEAMRRLGEDFAGELRRAKKYIDRTVNATLTEVREAGREANGIVRELTTVLKLARD